MDIIPQILTEREFSEFSWEDYRALQNVLDDTLSKYIKDYISNPEADATIVEAITTYLGPTIESLTFHYDLQERGILDLVSKLSPENLLTTNLDLNDIYAKLSYLEQNVDKLRTMIPGRTKESFNDFLEAIKGVVRRMADKGLQPTYPDVIKRIENNKFIFYVPNDKGHRTGSNVINSRRRQWTMCLRGIEFTKYCEEHNYNYFQRRAF